MKNFKFLGLLFLSGVMALTTACGGGSKKTDVTSIKLNTEEAEVVAGRSIDLTATVTPEDATDKTLTWTSSKESIATVTAAGKVNGIKEGECTITVASVSNTNVTATCKIKVLPAYSEWVISSVSRNKLLLDFDNNKSEKDNKEEEFFIRDKNLVVGTDNAFNIRPSLEIYDDNDNKVDDSQWPYGYIVEVSKKDSKGDYTLIGDEYYEVTNSLDGSIQFKTTAEGSTFKIVMTPAKEGEVKYKDSDKFSQTAIVDVVNGYNVTNALEFSLLDNRDQGEEYDEYNTDDTSDFGNPQGSFDTKWYEFKQEKGVENIDVKNIVLLNNISITKDDIPSTFIYETNEEAKAVGSMKDPMYIYRRTNDDDGETIIHGNYFTLDYSELPLIVRACGHKSTETENRLDSHSTLIRLTQGKLTINDVNVVGNGKRAVKEEDKVYSGSLMFVKTHKDALNLSINNVLCRKAYMTVMNEIDEANKFSCDVLIKDSKFYENYNSFLYNWGGHIRCEDSIMKNAGGPVVIADHIVYEGDSTTDPVTLKSDAVPGDLYDITDFPANTEFINCDLDSKLIGKEAWFDMMGATAVTPLIKQLSDLIALNSATPGTDGIHMKSYISDEDGNPVIGSYYEGTTVMSILSIGKSNSILSVADLPCKGVPTFTYKDEDSDFVIDYNIDELVDLGGQYVAFFEFFRSIRNMGLPIFVTSGGYAVAYPSSADLTSASWTLYDLVDLSVSSMKQTAPTPLDASSDFFTKADNYIALIYQGLSITMKLYNMVTPF